MPCRLPTSSRVYITATGPGQGVQRFSAIDRKPCHTPLTQLQRSLGIAREQLARFPIKIGNDELVKSTLKVRTTLDRLFMVQFRFLVVAMNVTESTGTKKASLNLGHGQNFLRVDRYCWPTHTRIQHLTSLPTFLALYCGMCLYTQFECQIGVMPI